MFLDDEKLTVVYITESKASSDSSLTDSESNDEIDLWKLLQAIWNGKWLILLFTAFFSIGAVLYALSLSDQYRAVSILAPASSSSSSSLSKLAGQFGGLASLAGVSLGGGDGADKTTIAIELMKTWGFLEQFILESNIAAEVFAATKWDKAKKQLIYDQEIYDPVSKKWLLDPQSDSGGTFEPSSWVLYQELSKRLTISKDKETGLIRVSLEFYSPELAKEWVDMLIKQINKQMKNEDKASAKKSIEFLTEQVSKTQVADMQAVFFQLIEEQAKTLMLAEVNDEYVLKTVSPAKIPEEKSGPKRALICIVGFLLGSGLGTIFILVRLTLNNRQRN
jgi:uncharacterized protein involved in exopolysaccharide biosynthesis